MSDVDEKRRAMNLNVSVGPTELSAMHTHGEQTYPDECCGAMYGPGDGRITHVFALSNTFPDGQRRRFLVGPDEYRRAEQHALDVNLALVGFYHSHPDHPAEPSAFDLEHAWPNLSYVIVSVRQGRADIARSWRLRADRSAFQEEQITKAITT